jgi:hypothetical protein
VSPDATFATVAFKTAASRIQTDHPISDISEWH